MRIRDLLVYGFSLSLLAWALVKIDQIVELEKEARANGCQMVPRPGETVKPLCVIVRKTQN